MNHHLLIKKPVNTRLLAVALTGFCPFLAMYVTQPLLPEFRQVFHATAAEVSLTVSATTIAVALSAPFIGLFADSLGRKRIIVPAIFALSIPMFLAATASGLQTLIGWRFIQGLFIPGIFTVTLAYISEEWAGAGVGAAMAAYISGNVFGSVSGRVIAGLVTAHLGWRWAFIVLGCLLLVSGMLTSRWLPASRRFVPHKDSLASIHAIFKHLRNPQLFAIYSVGFNILFVFTSVFTYITFYLAAAPFHLGSMALGCMFLVNLFGAVVTPIAGRWIDQFGYRIAVVCASAVSCTGVLLTLLPNLWIVLVGLSLCSAGVFVCNSAATSYLGIAAGHSRSSAAGLYVASYYMGGSVGAVLPGFIWTLGGWSACVALIVVIQFLTTSIALAFWQS